MVCLHTDTMGVHPACILFDGQGYSPPRPGIPPETTPPILHILPLIAHQLASAREKLLLYKLVRGTPKETFLILVAHREDWAICCPAS